MPIPDYADSDYIDSAHTNAVKTVPYAGPAASSTVIERHIDGDFFLDGDDAGTRNLLAFHGMCAGTVRGPLPQRFDGFPNVT